MYRKLEELLVKGSFPLLDHFEKIDRHTDDLTIFDGMAEVLKGWTSSQAHCEASAPTLEIVGQPSPKFGAFSYLLFDLAGHVAQFWNTIEPSLRLMYRKLKDIEDATHVS
jgi:hypothetical protein